MVEDSYSTNIQISQETIDNIQNEIDNRTAQELKQIGDDAALLMKKVALDFIKQLQKNLKDIQRVESDAKKLKAYRDEFKRQGKSLKDKATLEAYQNFKNQIQAKMVSEYSFENFFKAAMLFNDSILQIITGHQIKITIVIPSAENNSPFITSIPLKEIFKNNSGIRVVGDMTSGKTPRLVGRLNYNIEKMKDHFGEALHQDTILESTSLGKLNEVYNIAILDYRKWKPYAFWYIPPDGEWWKIKIGGAEGDISEAYAYFFYTGGSGGKTDNLFQGSKYRKNLDEFFREGVANVDNISGLYTSDIVTQEYDYAVKSLNASLPGFDQMIKLATDILKGEIQTRDQLKAISKQKQYKTNKRGESIRSGLRNVVSRSSKEEFLKQVQKKKKDIQIKVHI